MNDDQLKILLASMGDHLYSAEDLAETLGSRWSVGKVRKLLSIAKAQNLVVYMPRKIQVTPYMVCHRGLWRKKAMNEREEEVKRFE